MFLDHADAQSGQRRVQIARVVFRGTFDAGGVTRIESRHDIQHRRGVFCTARQHATLIKAGCKGDHAVARHQPVGRLEAGQAGQRSRLADGPAGIRRRGNRCHARRHRSRRSAGGSARNAGPIPRVLHRAIERCLVGGPHGKFVHVGLAENHRAGIVETADDMRIIGGNKIRQHLRPARRQPALCAEDVLVRHRNPGQRLRLAGRNEGISRARLHEAAFAIDGDEGVQVAVSLLDPVEKKPGQFDAGNLPGGKRGGEFFETGIEHVLDQKSECKETDNRSVAASGRSMSGPPQRAVAMSFNDLGHEVKAPFHLRCNRLE